MSSAARRDLLLSLGIGVAFLLFFHLDHLVNTYTGWSDPDWLLHLFVDGSYVLVYGAIGWIALRGWRVWRKRMKNLKMQNEWHNAKAQGRKDARGLE